MPVAIIKIPHILLATLLSLLFAVTGLVIVPVSMAGEILTIRVTGIEGDPLKNVTAAVTPPPGMVKDGRVDKNWLQRFTLKTETLTREAMEAYGYYGAKADTALEGDLEKGYTLTVAVTPGEPTRLDLIDIKTEGSGAAEKRLTEVVTAFPLQKGEVLLHEQYEKLKGDLLATARDLGYLDAGFTLHRLEVNPASASAAIHLTLATGPRYLFGECTLDGTTLFPEELLRRYISFKKGEPFSYKALGTTQLNFSSSPYFKSASVIPKKEKAEDYRIPITIALTPMPRKSIRPGIGFGTDTGGRASVAYKDLNLFSPGHIFTADTTIAQKLQGISLGYSIPDQSSIETVTSFQLNLQREDVNDIVTKLMAFELGRTTSLGANRLGTAFFRILDEQNISTLENSTSFLMMPGLRFSKLNYDDIINPTSGYHISIEIRGTSRLLGSDTEFLQLIAGGAYIKPLPWKLSLKSRLKGGTTVLDANTIELPSSLRFFAGGDNSVRGYGYKTLGPKDARGEVTGGKKLLQGSMELERALFGNWATSLFYDVGNAFNSSSDFKLYQGAGIGLHYKTLIGSINFDIARQIGVSDPRIRIHFTIGFQL